MTNTVEKFNTIAIGNIEKINTIAGSNIEDLNTLEFSALVPVTIAHTATAANSGAASSYTFSSQAFGAANSARRIIVVVGHGGSNRTISSMTIGGVSAANIVSNETVNSTDAHMYSAAVPSGTSGNVVINFNTTENRCGIGVFSMIGAASSATTTKSATNTTSNSQTLTVPAGGAALAYAVGQANNTYTFGGVTESFDAAIAATYTHGGACLAFENAQSPLTVTCALAGSASNSVFLAASFGPS